MANLNGFIAKGTNVVASATAIGEGLNKLFGKTKIPGPAGKSDINQFKSKLLNDSGLQRNNRFYFEVNKLPPVLTGGLQDAALTRISFAAEATSIPGVQLATTEVQRYGVGPTEKAPYRPIFVDLNVSFLCDGSRLIYDFFYDWINSIVKGDGRHIQHNSKVEYRVKRNSALLSYEVEYRDNYYTDLRIVTVDEVNQRIIVIDLYNAYPISIGDMAVSWSNTEFFRLPVTFAYQNWSRQEITVDQKDISKPSAGLLQKLQSLGSAVNVLSSIRRPKSISDIAGVVNNTNLGLSGIANLGVNKN